MAITNYLLDREFIEGLIPGSLRNTWVFQRTIDIFETLLSDDIESGKTMLDYYNDLMYYLTDFTKLTTEMKRIKLREEGYSYLLDLFETTDENLNNISLFFSLIKILKTRKEGLDLIFKAFNITYEYTSWEDTSPMGEVLTGKMKLYLSHNIDVVALVPKLRNFNRSYMLPLIDVLIASIDEVGAMNMYMGAAYIDSLNYSPFEISATLPTVECTLTINTTPSEATVAFSGDYTSVTDKSVTAVLGTTIGYSVSYEGYKTQSGTIVLNHDTTLNIELRDTYTLTIRTNSSSATKTVTYNGVTTTYTEPMQITPDDTVGITVIDSTYGTKTQNIIMDSDKTITFTGTSSTVDNYSIDSNLTTVGSPTITSEGMASNFTTSNYFTLDSSQYSITNFIIHIEFTPSDVTSEQWLFGNLTQDNQHIQMGIYILGDYARIFVNSEFSKGIPISINKTYYAQYSFDTGSHIFSIYNVTDNQWVDSVNSSGSSTAIWASISYLGTVIRQSYYGPATNCTINLKNTWIKSNGQYIINNMNTTYVYDWNVLIT